MRYLFYIVFIMICGPLISQVVVSTNPAAIPNPSAMLSLDSNKGLLIPRMSKANRLAISSPAQGLWVYQLDAFPGYYIFSGVAWVRVANNRTLKGKNVYTQPSGPISTGGYTGYTVTNPSVGEFNVTFATPFNDVPMVMLSNEAAPALPSVDPSVYCQPYHNNPCTTPIAADYMDDVRVQSCPTGGGSCTYIAPIGFQDNGTGCNTTPGNYVNNFNIVSKQATVYGLCHDAEAFFNISLRSSEEWQDGVFAFIDWNQDGDFEENNEVLVQENNPSPYNALITEPLLTVPMTAVNGVTVMRTMSLYASNIPAPCGTFAWGETQDYRINVVGSCGGASSSEPRACDCNPKDITASGFKVYCAIVSSDRPFNTSFDFYATEN
jgi:hypothetical protein